MRSITLLPGFLIANIRSFTTDRSSFLTYLAVQLFRLALSITFVWVVFLHVPEINGWSFWEVVFFTGLFEAAQGLFYFLFAWTLWFPTQYLIRGQFDIVLLLPVHSLMGVFLREFGNAVMEVLSPVLGLVIAFIAASKLDLVIDATSILKLLATIASGTILLGGVAISLTAISFWTGGRTSWSSAINSVSEVGRYPLTIYSRWIRAVLTFVVPLGFVSFYGGAWILRAGEYLVPGALSLPISIIVFAISVILWNAGQKRYESTGS